MTNQNDIGEAQETYSGFLTFLKWGTAVSLAVTALVVLIIAG